MSSNGKFFFYLPSSNLQRIPAKRQKPKHAYKIAQLLVVSESEEEPHSSPPKFSRQMQNQSPHQFTMFSNLHNGYISITSICHNWIDYEEGLQEQGTLKCEANRVLRTSLNPNVNDHFDADKDFIVSFTDAYIIEAITHFFYMESLFSAPRKNVLPDNVCTEDQKKEWVMDMFQKIVEMYVWDKDNKQNQQDNVKVNKNLSKYTYEILRLLVHQLCILSEQEAHEEFYGLFVNTKGKIDRHIPCDLQMEYIVKSVKRNIKHMFSNKTDKNITTRTSALPAIKDIAENFDKTSGVIIRYNEVDGFTLIHLEEKDIFSMIPGKIGPARKIITLLQQMKETNRTCDSKISNESEQCYIRNISSESLLSFSLQISSDYWKDLELSCGVKGERESHIGVRRIRDR
ncbi:unnamed protein product [Mytilus edulis]|uniref:DUF6589 domain-containing protein n=1 Tax=Mytilus edulis TaxID=6550 RepID=A0A8S3U4R3_MYTED|nr:unnamed protein product [Mytilus edulis]